MVELMEVFIVVDGLSRASNALISGWISYGVLGLGFLSLNVWWSPEVWEC